MRRKIVRIGTAGWSIPKKIEKKFPDKGTHLERYSQVFNCVEINSSFYRDHKSKTYARWALSTPDDFSFSIKLSRFFTQQKKLKECVSKLEEALKPIQELQEKWGSLLVQLPPSLEFDQESLVSFLDHLRKIYSGILLWEPRHLSWREDLPMSLLKQYDVYKVLADPEPCPIIETMQIEKVRYDRLHGSPEIYRSRYESSFIHQLALSLEKSYAIENWVIFDNTTFGYATENALELCKKVLEVK